MDDFALEREIFGDDWEPNAYDHCCSAVRLYAIPWEGEPWE